MRPQFFIFYFIIAIYVRLSLLIKSKLLISEIITNIFIEFQFYVKSLR